MARLTEDQKKNLINWLENFAKSPTIFYEGLSEEYHVFDSKRNAAATELKKLVDSYLSGKIGITEFKEKSEAACRTHPYWGFKGFAGQMQLNQFVNNIADNAKEPHFKDALKLPENVPSAVKKISELSKYLSDARLKASNPRALPWTSQAYLLSYFWELQKPCGMPVYYNSTKKVLNSIGFELGRFDDPGEEYKEFFEIITEICALFVANGRKDEKFPYWFVEHVIWTQFVKMQESVAEPEQQAAPAARPQPVARGAVASSSVLEWVPPIIQDLNDLAHNCETAWSVAKGVRPEKAFETKLRYAFTILGYETTELGQGTGREPDGVALSRDVRDSGDYAIVYDAKARQDYFNLGTGDREIYEYVQKKKEELRRQKRINKLYFVIISSDFGDPNAMTSAIRDIYRRTQVPVLLLKAADLLFIVEARLQDSEMDHVRLEELFLENGLITRDKIIEALGLR